MHSGLHSKYTQNAFNLHSKNAFNIAFQIACKLHSICIRIAFWANAKANFRILRERQANVLALEGTSWARSGDQHAGVGATGTLVLGEPAGVAYPTAVIRY